MELEGIVSGVGRDPERAICLFRNAFRLCTSDLADVRQVESVGTDTFVVDGDFDDKGLVVFKLDAVAFGHKISAFGAIVQVDGHLGGLRCKVEGQP